MSRDMMPSFELYQPDSVEGAARLAKDLDADGWVLAGGQDSYDWFKDRAKRPEALVDLSGIAALKGIRETDAGLEVGALAADEHLAAAAGVLDLLLDLRALALGVQGAEEHALHRARPDLQLARHLRGQVCIVRSGGAGRALVLGGAFGVDQQLASAIELGRRVLGYVRILLGSRYRVPGIR